MFPNSWGSPMWISTAGHALDRSLKGVGVDRHIRIHDLRHTCASLMIQNGVPPKAVQDILGHSTYVVTMNTYVHTNPEMLRTAVDILGKAIGSTGYGVLVGETLSFI